MQTYHISRYLDEAEGNTEEQPCQPEENSVHPDSLIGFRFYFK